MRDSVSLYKNAGILSKVSENTASENTENCGCRQPQCLLMHPLQETPADICINLILPETRVIGLHLRR